MVLPKIHWINPEGRKPNCSIRMLTSHCHSSTWYQHVTPNLILQNLFSALAASTDSVHDYPESCKLMNPSSNMSSMEEPLLPLVRCDQKPPSSMQDRSKFCDVPNRCTTSFHPNSNSKANFCTLDHPPSTLDNSNIVSTPALHRVRSSPSVFTAIKEAPGADELDEQGHANK